MKLEEAKQAAGDGQGNDDNLFVAASNFAIEIFRQGRTKNTALELSTKALWFADHIIEHFESEDPLSEPLACKAGCHYCCFYQVLLSPPEVLLIGNYVETLYTEKDKRDLTDKIATTLELTDGKSARERAKTWHDTPCIFLADGKCSIYQIRPFACRAWHSLDSNQCKKAFESNSRLAEVEGYSHRHHTFLTVKAALQRVCMDMGCQTGTLPIANAMKEYFSHQAPINAWIKGDQVFKVMAFI